MATLSTARPTFLDVTKRLDPDGGIAKIGEILVQRNAVLDHVVWVEGNQTFGHQYTLRTSNPAVSWRKLNQGVAPTKSSTSQYTDVCGEISAYNEVDRKVAAMNGNTTDFRLSEATATMDEMNNEFAEKLCYGDVLTAPAEMTGIIPRYNVLSGGTTSDNVINAGGSGSDNASILLVCWGEDTVFGIYPKGSKAGITFEDKGLVTLADANGNPFEGYRSYFEWDCGLCVKDWRYIVRIANIDISDLLTAGEAGDVSAHIIKFMLQAMHRIPNLGIVNPVFYANRTVMEMLDTKLVDKGNMAVSVSDIVSPNGFPRPAQMKFMGIPVMKVDKLLNTETAVA